MSAYSVDITRIIIRLAMATVVAGIIGSNREHNSHPAGIRTHILVCLGACVIAMIQQEIAAQAINFALHNKDIFFQSSGPTRHGWFARSLVGSGSWVLGPSSSRGITFRV